MIVKIPQAIEGVTTCMFTKLVANVVGSPGTGKSAIVKQLAQKYRLKLVDRRLSQYDRVDLNGFPKVGDRRSTFVPMDTFPLEDDEVPESYKGFLIFLDEFNAAPLSVQAAAYRIALDRQVGDRDIHPKAVIVCAGNLMTDGAIVNRLSTAMQSRLVHFHLEVDPISWLNWASANHLATEVIAHINAHPDKLHDFRPDHDDMTFACPRTWHFTSRIVKYKPEKPIRDKLATIAGTISEAHARYFADFAEVYKDIPTYEDIKTSPLSLAVPSEPATGAALAGIIGSNMVAKDADTVMPFVDRMPMQFQVMAMRDAYKRNKTIMKAQAATRWFNSNGHRLFAEAA